MSNAVERARDLLATITPGPWEFTDDPTPFGWTTRKIVHPNDPYHELNVLKVRMAKSARNECCWPPTRADAEFIAAAPQLVADLLDELDATTNYYNMACTRCDSHPDSFTHQDVCVTPRLKLEADLAEARNVIEQVRPALESLADVLAFSARDWGQARDLAWLWGIIHGWDDDEHDEDSAMPEMARVHGWDEVEVARLRRLHAAYESILADAEGSGQ